MKETEKQKRVKKLISQLSDSMNSLVESINNARNETIVREDIEIAEELLNKLKKEF